MERRVVAYVACSSVCSSAPSSHSSRVVQGEDGEGQVVVIPTQDNFTRERATLRIKAVPGRWVGGWGRVWGGWGRVGGGGVTHVSGVKLSSANS